MKKIILIATLVILSSIQISYSAGKAKLMNEDISDLIVQGFEVFNVTVGANKVIYTLKMIKIDSKLAKYPPFIMCVVSLDELLTGCFDIN